MRKFVLAFIEEKSTGENITNILPKKIIKDIIAGEDQNLGLIYEEGNASYLYDKVIDIEETDYGLWVETESRLYRFDYCDDNGKSWCED